VIPPALTPNPAAGAAHSVVAVNESQPMGRAAISAGRRSTARSAYTSSLLREYEFYRTDTDVADQQAGTVAGLTKRRLVYADVFPLSVPITSLTWARVLLRPAAALSPGP
jgi:hypothetical protein